MGKGIHADDSASVWAVIMMSKYGGGNGFETVMCATERDAIVYAWFHNDRHCGDAQIIEMPLMVAKPWSADGQRERVRSKGISVTRRKRA